MKEKYRVLFIASHPVQYQSPIFRLMAQHPRLDMEVAYCSLQGAEAGHDPGFGIEVKWDVPLLEGYPWTEVPNKSLAPRLERFWGLVNPGLWRLVCEGGFDAVVAYTGYAYASFWILAGSAKLHGVPLLFGTDATSLEPRDGKRWKKWVKKLVLPGIFRLASIVTVPSSAGRRFIGSLGIPDSRIHVTPFTADNEWWLRQAALVDRAAVRRRWKIPEEASVALFCAKLQAWKRPQDVLRAFAKADAADSYLVFAGEGPLSAELKAEANSLGIGERTLFLGFVNQSELPSVYRAADLFVISSQYDPCPIVVCEAMVCGCPVILSDEIRGRFDLVENGKTGFIFPCGDVEALARLLRETLPAKERLREMGQAARQRMETWSPRENIEGQLAAIESACGLR